jgi:hypothetical protein
MIEAGFHPSVAHVILMNSILWVDTIVSQGPATWAREFKEEYKAMAEYQRDAVRDLIVEVASNNLYCISHILYKCSSAMPRMVESTV